MNVVRKPRTKFISMTATSKKIFSNFDSDSKKFDFYDCNAVHHRWRTSYRHVHGNIFNKNPSRTLFDQRMKYLILFSPNVMHAG